MCRLPKRLKDNMPIFLYWTTFRRLMFILLQIKNINDLFNLYKQIFDNTFQLL